MTFTLRQLAPDDAPLLEAMLTMFGDAFSEPDTYNAARPSRGYLSRLLGRDHFIAVAALDGDGGPACFTNSGHWVDACAPGVGARSTFLNVEAEPARLPPPNCLGIEPAGKVRFEGWATWSGTSAAAPRVAGAVAAVIGPGVDGPSAAFALVGASSVPRLPGLGAVVDPPAFV